MPGGGDSRGKTEVEGLKNRTRKCMVKNLLAVPTFAHTHAQNAHLSLAIIIVILTLCLVYMSLYD